MELEKEVETVGFRECLRESDNKQWAPIYGIRQVGKDIEAEKPTVLDNWVTASISTAYQFTCYLGVATTALYIADQVSKL